MSAISQATTILAHSMALALIHSLWQGLLLFALLFVLLKTVPGFSTRLKYYLSYGAFTGLFIWFVQTWVSQFGRLKSIEVVSYVSLKDIPVQFTFNNINVAPVVPTAPPFSSQVLHFIEQNVPSIMTIYMAGLAFMLLRFLVNILSLNALKTQGITDLESKWTDLINDWCRQFAISREVKLLLSSRINVPIMLGTLKPVILLPIATINHLTSEQVEAILLHEFAHIKRHDYLLNMLQTAGETILFFNPFVWLISQIIRRQREDCCDDLVVANTASPLQYAQALAILEHGRSNDQQLALAATGNRKHLLNRIKRIMVMKKDSPGYGQLSILLLSFIALAFIVALCTFTPSMAQRAKGSKSDSTRKKTTIGKKPTTIDNGRNETSILNENKPQKQVKAFGSRDEQKRINDSIAEEQRYLAALHNPDTTKISITTKDGTNIEAALFDDPLKMNRIFKSVHSVFKKQLNDEELRTELDKAIRTAYKDISSQQLDILIVKTIDKFISRQRQNDLKSEGFMKMIAAYKKDYLDSFKITINAENDTFQEINHINNLCQCNFTYPVMYVAQKVNGQLYLNEKKQSKALLDKYGSSLQEGKGIKTYFFGNSKNMVDMVDKGY